MLLLSLIHDQKVELRVISLVKNELKRFRNLLSPDCSEGHMKEDEDQSDVREGALKITLHVLKKMDQINLATILQASKNLESHGSFLKDDSWPQYSSKCEHV